MFASRAIQPAPASAGEESEEDQQFRTIFQQIAGDVSTWRPGSAGGDCECEYGGNGGSGYFFSVAVIPTLLDGCSLTRTSVEMPSIAHSLQIPKLALSSPPHRKWRSQPMS